MRTRRGDIRRVTAKSRDKITKQLQNYRIQDVYDTFREKLTGKCEFMKNDGRYVTRYIHGTNLKKEFWYTPILQWKVNNGVKIGRCYIAPSERPTRVGVPLIFEDGPIDEQGRHTVVWTAYGDKEDLFEYNKDSEGPTPDP